MAFIQNNLRRQVLGRAAEGVSLAVDDFGETEVRQLQVAVSVDQHILGFQVSVDDVFAVQVLEDGNDVRGVKSNISYYLFTWLALRGSCPAFSEW